jgi:hypothetical protein
MMVDRHDGLYVHFGIKYQGGHKMSCRWLKMSPRDQVVAVWNRLKASSSSNFDVAKRNVVNAIGEAKLVRPIVNMVTGESHSTHVPEDAGLIAAIQHRPLVAKATAAVKDLTKGTEKKESNAPERRSEASTNGTASEVQAI